LRMMRFPGLNVAGEFFFKKVLDSGLVL